MRLVLTCNDSKLDDVDLGSGLVTIGRKSDNDVQLADPVVSGYHAQIFAHDGAHCLEDLESTNGTYVNGRRIRRHLLLRGDVVTIGKHRFLYDPDGTVISAPEQTLQMDARELEKALAGAEMASNAGPFHGKINWIAQDKYGVWWGFENRPLQSPNGWYETDGPHVRLKQDHPAGDWRETLQRIGDASVRTAAKDSLAPHP